MELEKQVCSLELSKRLKKLGVSQESLFYWENTIGQKDKLVWKIIYRKDCQFYDKQLEYYSAFTISELVSILPDDLHIKDEWYSLYIIKNAGIIGVSYKMFVERKTLKEYVDENLANILAKMLIYLLENKFIELTDSVGGKKWTNLNKTHGTICFII